MKKYVKPEVLFEKFELNQHIADCAWELQQGSKDACVAEPDDKKLPGLPTLFTETASCYFTEDVYQDFCYQNGASSANVFMS